MDYDIPLYLSQATVVDVVLRPEGEWFISFFVSVESLTTSAYDTVWLSATKGGDSPTYYIDGKRECKAELPPENLENGWIRLRVNLVDFMSATFGKDGWQYQRVLRIRLRGAFAISKINFRSTSDPVAD